MKRCTKGKSCGATCIDRRERCVLELGPIISKSVHNVREKLGVMALWRQVQAQGKGGGVKFNKIKKQVEIERAQGRALRKQADLIEFKNRLQKEGLLPKSAKSDKSDDLGAIFAKAISAGKKEEKAPSMPSDLRRQLFALPGAPAAAAKTTPSERYRRRVAEAEEAAKRGEKPAPVEGRKIDKSPEAARMKPPASPTKGNTDLIFDDISRMMRGESPQNIQVASAPGELGMKGRMKPETSGPGSATGNTKWARLDAKDHDDGLYNVRREGDAKYDGWKDSYGSGARKIGEGAYGTVMRNPDGTFVKRGDISDTEAALIKRLGDRDLGPKLIAADINGPARYHQENFVDVKNGRIAMGEVPGKPIGAAGPGTQFGGRNAADIYWKAMADLHRMGIAHNDAHIDNILVDDKGKGRWVDLGLAQASPRAALAEALGVFKPLKGGDAITVPAGARGEGNWQTARWDGTGVKAAQRARDGGTKTWGEFQQRFPVAAQVWENKPAVIYELKRMGLDVNEINSMIAHGIRSPLSSYDESDGFGRITDKQAQNLLNMLYDGI